MSELSKIAEDVVTERASWTSDPVLHLATGRTITAEIDGSPDAIVLAQMELGEDYRNVCLLHVTNDTEAAILNQGDLVTFTLFGSLSRWKILKRRDSGAQLQTDFWAQQLTPKDTN
jgi:hypothetical protein